MVAQSIGKRLADKTSQTTQLFVCMNLHVHVTHSINTWVTFLQPFVYMIVVNMFELFPESGGNIKSYRTPIRAFWFNKIELNNDSKTF